MSQNKLPLNAESSIDDGLLQFESGPLPRKRRVCLIKCLLISIATVTALTIVLFVTLFVGVPLAFRYSPKFQRMIIFMPMDTTPEQFQYMHNHANGTRNFYVNIDVPDNLTLGVLHLLPLPLIEQSVKNKNFNYDNALARSDYPVLLHFHGNGGNRFHNLEVYLRLRQYFHVLGFDYQCFGDSSKYELTEDKIVEVSISLYKWLIIQTPPDNIYVWGHSLGGAIAAHTLARLTKDNIVPKGLVLEATFPSLRDEVQYYQLAKLFTWLPWFEFTIQSGLEANGFIFNTCDYVLNVNCPVMILHAEDDTLIPYSLAQKLNNTIANKRNLTTQGNVTFHTIPSVYKCNHWAIVKAPEFPIYMQEYILTCEEYYNKTKGDNTTEKAFSPESTTFRSFPNTSKAVLSTERRSVTKDIMHNTILRT